MSDARAIEAVTQTLRNLVDLGVKEVEASAVAVARPLDRVADTNFEMQVNLFLYQASVDPALRNEPPYDVLPGESGDPALPLVLHYLLTPYASDGDELQAHRMLGGALRILHEHSVLSRTELAQIAPYSDLSQQLDRITISWQGLEEKDIYSLWSAFQSPYRLSAAFEVRVVLIDSRRSRTAPLPVLSRGADDRGPVAQADTALPFATLTAALAPNGQPAAYLGDQVSLQGAKLTTGGPITIRLSHPLLSAAVPVSGAAISDLTDSSLRFTVPSDAANLPAGLWSVAVLQPGTGGAEQATNEVPLALAPRITSPMPMTVARASNGSAVLDISCEPEVRPGQPVSLVLGAGTVAAQPITAATGTLQFRLASAEAGVFVTRLRVAGLDSPVVDRSQLPPAFDASQTVTVT